MKLAFPVFALFLFTACTAGAANKVAGTYTLDTKAFLAAMPAAEQAKAKEMGMDPAKMLADLFEGMSMELAADGTATRKMKNPQGKVEEEKGTWKLDGDKITLTTKDKDSGKDEVHTGKFHDGTITIDVTEPGIPVKQMVFRKK